MLRLPAGGAYHHIDIAADLGYKLTKRKEYSATLSFNKSRSALLLLQSSRIFPPLKIVSIRCTGAGGKIEQKSASPTGDIQLPDGSLQIMSCCFRVFFSS